MWQRLNISKWENGKSEVHFTKTSIKCITEFNGFFNEGLYNGVHSRNFYRYKDKSLYTNPRIETQNFSTYSQIHNYFVIKKVESIKKITLKVTLFFIKNFNLWSIISLKIIFLYTKMQPLCIFVQKLYQLGRTAKIIKNSKSC